VSRVACIIVIFVCIETEAETEKKLEQQTLNINQRLSIVFPHSNSTVVGWKV